MGAKITGRRYPITIGTSAKYDSSNATGREILSCAASAATYRDHSAGAAHVPRRRKRCAAIQLANRYSSKPATPASHSGAAHPTRLETFQGSGGAGAMFSNCTCEGSGKGMGMMVRAGEGGSDIANVTPNAIGMAVSAAQASPYRRRAEEPRKIASVTARIAAIAAPSHTKCASAQPRALATAEWEPKFDAVRRSVFIWPPFRIRRWLCGSRPDRRGWLF